MPSKTGVILRKPGSGRLKGCTRSAANSFTLMRQLATRPEPSSMAVLMADRPHIIGHRGEIGLGELGATHRRHHTRVVLGLRDAVRDRPGNRLDAAVPP